MKRHWTARKLFSVLILSGLGFLCPSLSLGNLLWDPPRGTAGDLWADIVLGQTDGGIKNSAFGELKPNEATNRSTWTPRGIVVDRNHHPNRLYMWDAGNSRILGFSDINMAITRQGGKLGVDLCLGSDPTAYPLGADIVLGQPDFSHCACNGDSNMQNYPVTTAPNPNELCGLEPWANSPWEDGSDSNMAVDGSGNLYVPDVVNNRVLLYEFSNLKSGAMGPAASYVWGQPDLYSYKQNQGLGSPTAGTFNFVGGKVGRRGLPSIPKATYGWPTRGTTGC